MRAVAHRYTLIATAVVLLALPGCSANPAYEPIFQELVASIRRVNAAMKDARNAATVKKAVEVLAKETETIDGLMKKLQAHGKPNSASKKVAEKFFAEHKSVLEDEVSQAAEHFKKALDKARVSQDDRFLYLLQIRKFSEALQLFDITWNMIGK